MDDLRLAGSLFTPVGRLVPALTISRRTFMGGSLAVPGAALLLRSPPSLAANEDINSTLRFVEDSQSITVVHYPRSPEAKADSSSPSEPGADAGTPAKKDVPPPPSAQSWVLMRRAFGPETKFLLRTLQDGVSRGYELQVAGPRYGSLDVSNHRFVFLRDKDSWKVRLRTQLWTPSASGLAELTSIEVPFVSLCLPRTSGPHSPARPSTVPSSQGFVIRTDGQQIAPALTRVFDGHLTVRGPLELVLHRDGVWLLRCLSGAQMTLFDGAFTLPAIEFSWCDPSGPSSDKAMPADKSSAPRSQVNDPTFCATAKAIARKQALVLSPSRPPYVVLTARPASDPQRPASEEEESHVATDPKVAPAVDRRLATLAEGPLWTYTRSDWAWRPHAGAEHPHGNSQLKAAWDVRMGVERGSEFGPLCIQEGVLQSINTSPPSIRFAGRIEPIDQFLESRVGRLNVRGWTVEDGDIALSSASSRSHHPLVTVATTGLNSPVLSIDVPMLLLGAELAPEDCDFSLLSFAPTSFRAIYDAQPARASQVLARAQSYLWLGNEQDLHGLPLAHIDLTQARLEVSRVKDLARLAFMFAGLHLNVGGKKAWIADARETCRVIQRAVPGSNMSDPIVIDTRSTLVVEFPPQHVFEESLFRPGGPELPDVEVDVPTFEVDWSEFSAEGRAMKLAGDKTITFSTSIQRLLRQIEGFRQPRDRMQIRAAYAKLKIDKEADAAKPFFRFCEPFDELFREKQGELAVQGLTLPIEQMVYIGPQGMDADVAALARRVSGELQAKIIDGHLNEMLASADALLDTLKKSGLTEMKTGGIDDIFARLFNFVVGLIKRDTSDAVLAALAPAAMARLRERAVASTMQEYAYFRDFYLEQMNRLLFDAVDSNRQQEKLQFGKLQADDLEYFSPSNRVGLSVSGDLAARKTFVLRRYVDAVRDTELPPEVMRARLAGPSRLAFRVDCGTRRSAVADDEWSEPVAASLGPVGTRIPFSFDALTDWSRFELAVTPRAMQVVAFDDAGILIKPDLESKIGDEDGTSDDVALLKLLGFKGGQTVTAQERIAEVESSLKVTPTSLQTSIELPARLILSPSQKAVWRTRRANLPWMHDTSGPTPLWTADLILSDSDPLVRAVHSPDLRPGFVRGGLEGALARAQSGQAAWAASAAAWAASAGAKSEAETASRVAKRTLHTPIVGPPPRGPRAPWTLGIEETDPDVSSLGEIYRATLPSEGSASAAAVSQLPISADETEICAEGSHAASGVSGGAPAASQAVAVDSTSASAAVSTKASEDTTKKSATKLPLAAPSARRASTLHPLVDYLCRRQADKKAYGASAIFRSSLDAYDRHELVLLSSAWGLPVRGRREANGQLQAVKTSSQVDLPADWRPIDVETGTAFYRPRALKVQELALSSLGGTLRHDSDFVPPSAARHIAYGPLFDSLSIERWQHWTVLGRDVFAEAVYKGYLFPIGHRASLVKQTERIFLRPKAGGSVRAYLRQRMFIRIAQPDKTFPALGQPNGGRQFPANRVRLLTLTTPDIVDPAEDRSNVGDDAAPGGRLFANEAGLVFWPRTARVSGTDVHFEMQIEDSLTSAALIFVDNVAINRPDLMERLVRLYNRIASPDMAGDPNSRVVPSRHKRTLDLAGQAKRYCDELKPGAASHKTLYWTLKATGGAGSTSASSVQPPPADNSWEGAVTKFDDPSLEGADQPPFYPALETARLRVDQVERMTGSPPKLVLAQFDGWYVQNGFAKSNAKNAREEPLQIYLAIVSDVPLSMGANGDRSGGVFRPAGKLIALSRQRGPLTGLSTIPVGPVGSVTPDSYPVVDVPSSTPTQPVATGVAPAQASPADDKAYARYFNYTPTPAPGVARPPPAVPDTLILGLVSLAELLEFMKLGAAASGLPALQEVVEYGVGGAEAGAEVLRKQVISPLYGLVQDLDKQWRRAGEQVSLKLPGFIGSMAEVFPDVDQALHDLLTALGSSATSSDDAALFGSLAAVYEGGRRLVDACGRVASHPLDSLQLALQKKLSGLSDAVQAFRGVLSGGLTQSATNVLFGLMLGADEKLRLFGYPFKWMSDLIAGLAALRDLIDLDGVNDAIKHSHDALLVLPDFDKVLTDALTKANSTGPFDADTRARDTIGELLQHADEWLGRAEKPLLDAKPKKGAATPSPTASPASEAAPAVATGRLGKSIDLIEAQREQLRLSRALIASADIHRVKDSDYGLLFESLSILLNATHVVALAVDEAQHLNFARISEALADYLELIVGPLTLPLPDKVGLKKLLATVSPDKSLIKLIADPTADFQVLPASGTGGQFKVPSWTVPGDSDSLVAFVHRIAIASEDALKSKALLAFADLNGNSVRKGIADVGRAALQSEIDLLAAAVNMQRALNALVTPDLTKVDASLQSFDFAFHQFTLFIAAVRLALDKLLKVVASVPDLATRAEANTVVDASRRMLTGGMGWLKQMNDAILTQLNLWKEFDPASAQPLLEQSSSYNQAIEGTVKFDLVDGGTSRDQWLSAPDKWWPQLPSIGDTAPRAVDAAIGSLQQRVTKQILRWRQSLLELASPRLDAVLAAAMKFLAPVVTAYSSLDTARTDAFNAAGGTPLDLISGVLLVKVNPDHLYDPSPAPPAAGTTLTRDTSATNTQNDQLHWDLMSLQKLNALDLKLDDVTRKQAAKFLSYFFRSWSAGNATPQLIIQQVQRISLEDLRARLLSMIDFAAIREQIEDQIKLLIPSAATLSYDFETSIGAGAASATGGIFKPKEGCALSVHSTTRVDLLKGTPPQFSSVGELGAFDISLVGSFLDAVTLHFNGLRFESHGGPFDCDLQYAGFTIGPALKFISELQQYFGSKPGSGFYLKALDTGFGMEAGYGLNLGTIPLGDLSFFNVSLNAAARLPFDDRHSTFVASLSRRDAPFTISIAPYGGSGFFALEADTKGIVGFEASFEYGGAGAFAYGPLSGQGRIMTGIYIRSSYSSTEISATFYAGGSASIWMFSFGASLYVNAHPADNRMVGDATYSFSFSMGIVDYDYHVTVHVSIAWGSGNDGSTKQSAKNARAYVESDDVLLAEADTSLDGVLIASDAGSSRAGPPLPRSKKAEPLVRAPAKPESTRRIDTVCQALDWGRYSSYFTIDPDVWVEEF